MMVHVAGVTMEEETEEKISNREAKRAQVCLTGKKEYEKTNYERIAKKEQGWFVGCCMKEEKPEELCRHICSHEGEEGHSDQWGLLRVTGETTVKVRSRPKYGYWQLGARMCCRAIKDPDWKEKKKPPAVLHGGPDDTAVVTLDVIRDGCQVKMQQLIEVTCVLRQAERKGVTRGRISWWPEGEGCEQGSGTCDAQKGVHRVRTALGNGLHMFDS